ncbi:alpha/beta fold hydrolase [Streptomyces sp. 11x1]|uniref:thioesterase II family protein n=1 Tax=Streptomyces sp. 11x1 TaxID=3038642 RepID=UPI0029305656|nr:alpha/beta fold hydrolase [Streptomyces sp. 11x1]WNZ06244.1 alpha/beta fold hydrolase [Streptomyces sp. 11x1]
MTEATGLRGRRERVGDRTADPVGRWLLSGPPRPGAPRLYCFPHAGGNPVEYLRWAELLPGTEVQVVQLPGRGPRYGEPDAADMADLVAGILDGIRTEAPFAFFGHSFGALVAYETSRALRDTGRRLPRDLVVSAYPAPHLAVPWCDPGGLSDGELLRAVADRHGGIPAEVVESRLLHSLVARPLRADLRLIAGHGHQPGVPMPVPLTVFGGTGDRLSRRSLSSWQDHTTESFTVRMFPGGHFYLREHEELVLSALRDLIVPLGAEPSPAGPSSLQC